MDGNDFLEIRKLYHHGIKGQKHGVRRFQNEDGSLTAEGKIRYQKDSKTEGKQEKPKNTSGSSDNSKQIKTSVNIGDTDKSSNKANNESSKNKYGYESDMLKSVQKAVNDSANAINTNKGSIKIRTGNYDYLSDAELSRRIDRLTKEKNYAELKGDYKYVYSGKEKVKESLQTIGAVLGIGVSALTVAKLYKDMKTVNKK